MSRESDGRQPPKWGRMGERRNGNTMPNENCLCLVFIDPISNLLGYVGSLLA